MITFGEQVHFRPLDSYRVESDGQRLRGDPGERVMSGHYVGTHGRNADALVMTTQGIIKGNTVHRKTAEEPC